MALEIPKEDSVALTAIKELTPASLEKLIAALESAPPVSNPDEMAERIARQVPSIPPARLGFMLATLYTLYHIRELSGVRHARFIEDLLEAVRKNLPQKEVPKFRSLLGRLLGIDTLKTVAKAARLQRDGERLYCEAKILSDIRPIFYSDPSVPPVSAVLTHALRIGYHEGSQHKEFHVILDSEDLIALSEVVVRAQAKDKTLCGLLKRTKLTNLGE